MTDAPIPWIRPELARPSPYRWQEGIPEGEVGRFDMNTLPVSPAGWAEIAERMALEPSCHYPEAHYHPLRDALAGYAGVPAEQLVVGAGADEIIQLCATLALGRGDRAVVLRPTYSLHAIASRIAGAEVVQVDPLPGPDLRLDLDALVRVAPDVRLVWLCSPNNPTGEEIPAARVAELCRACPGLVVLDQAYVELGGDDHSGLLADHPNLVVVRTLSKGWALAALRVGYALASPAVAGALDALRPPGSLSQQVAVAAELAVRNVDAMRQDGVAFVAERARLADGMRALGLEVVGENAHFVLARTPWTSEEAFAGLAARRCAVRTFGHEPVLEGCIRASISTPAWNDRLLAALAEMVGRPAPWPHEPATLPGTWSRRGTATRRTRETTIDVLVHLDGSGEARVDTGVGFLDHMLGALAHHGLLDLALTCRGDLEIDEHHTVEDCGIALGEALRRALGDRRGIRRFGDAAAPLDEAVARAVVDISGRGEAHVDLALSGRPVGGIAPTLFPHLLDALATRAGLTLHLEARGTDDHHVVEAAFKALARALRSAVERDPRRSGIASTKGVL